MHIVDLEGKRIEVTDLKGAIVQAEVFVGYATETLFGDGFKVFDEKEKKYWQDILEKLKELE